MQFNDYLNEIYVHQKNNFNIIHHHSYALSVNSIKNALKELTEFTVLIVCFTNGNYLMYEYDIYQDNFILRGQSEFNSFSEVLFDSHTNMSEFIVNHISDIYGTW